MPAAPAVPRTWFTTFLGVAAILLGGLGTLFSAFALVLALGSPYANASTTVLDIFLIFILPPGTLLAGIGLLRRRRAARWWMILLMTGLLSLGGKGLLAPDHSNPTYAPIPGPAAEAAKQAAYFRSAVCIGAGAAALLGLFSAPVRREFQPANQPPMTTSQWRVGHRGRDMMYYEENHNGEWQRIDIDGEMLTGRAHHVIYFANPDTWQNYPGWARHRRDEIIARIKSQFREPDYEYADNGTASSATTTPPSHRGGTILPALIALLAIAAASLWFAWHSHQTGETRLPLKQSHPRRGITRAEDPGLYWTSLGIHTTIGAGSLLLSVWLIRHRSRAHSRDVN